MKDVSIIQNALCRETTYTFTVTDSEIQNSEALMLALRILRDIHKEEQDAALLRSNN